MQVLPSEVQSGYLLTEIHSSPSEYAFNAEPSYLRVPVQTHSEYQLPTLNPWKTATSSSAYHYVSPAELKPNIDASRSIFGNPLSLSALKERLNSLESGIYRPAIVDGTLYFVASETATVTARATLSESDLKQETKTAVEKCSEDVVKTGRFPQSPTVSKSDVKSEVKLSLKQLRKLLGKELFNTVLKRYRKATGENHFDGTHDDESSLIGSTAREPSIRSSSSVDTAHSFGVFDSCYSTRTAVDPEDDVHTGKQLRTSNSSTSISTHSFGVFDSCYSTKTAVDPEDDIHTGKQLRTANSSTSISSNQRTQIDTNAFKYWDNEMKEKYGKQNSELSLVTAMDSDISMASSASTHADDDLAKNEWDKEMERKYNSTKIEKLEPNQERSTTEVGSGLIFGQTPTSFDQRASFSGRYLGDAVDANRFASLDGDVNTAKQNSKTNLDGN
uniref:Uncharacterized protein n=1 Tax=Panagrolaimus sp. JU765 TaxID=591449 RepID=A0AC34RHY2_9BILA